jgi:hypothetical protein
MVILEITTAVFLRHHISGGNDKLRIDSFKNRHIYRSHTTKISTPMLTQAPCTT